MGKGYYIVGALLIGVGGYFLYNKIKNGNVTFNFRNEDVAQAEDGSHLGFPMETPITIPPTATPPFVPTV
jgi:hypothetical protein